MYYFSKPSWNCKLHSIMQEKVSKKQTHRKKKIIFHNISSCQEPWNVETNCTNAASVKEQHYNFRTILILTVGILM